MVSWQYSAEEQWASKSCVYASGSDAGTVHAGQRNSAAGRGIGNMTDGEIAIEMPGQER